MGRTHAVRVHRNGTRMRAESQAQETLPRVSTVLAAALALPACGPGRRSLGLLITLARWQLRARSPRRSGCRRPRHASHLHSPAVIFICGGNEVVSGAPSVAEPDIQIACRVACYPRPDPPMSPGAAQPRARISLFPAALSPLSRSSLPFVSPRRLLVPDQRRPNV